MIKKPSGVEGFFQFYEKPVWLSDRLPHDIFLYKRSFIDNGNAMEDALVKPFRFFYNIQYEKEEIIIQGECKDESFFTG